MRLWTAVAGLVWCAIAAQALAQTSARPNVLLLMPDQMRGQAMGIAGNPDVKTPVLDALAGEGVYFPNALANTPLCCPARATILTGQYPQKHGMICNDLRLREEVTTLAEILKKHGYRTGFIGKWHLDGGRRMPGYIPPGPRRQGFDFWAANQCSHKHHENQYFRDNETPIPMTDYESRVWTDLAIEFLNQKSDEPFFLEVAMGPPHDPYRAPEPFDTMYDPEKLTLPPNWKPGTHGREEIAQYYGMITDVDEQIGRILKTLDELGIAENTIVLVTSDHGDMLGSQGTKFKRVPWEESIRVPGILRYPAKVKAGQKLDTLFTHVDIAPTLLGFCGVEVPSAMQGWDLSSRLRGITNAEPDWALLQHFTTAVGGGETRPWRAIRTKTHLYARHNEAPWLLYDLQNDPYQLNNLADKPEAAAIQRQLDNAIALMMRSNEDSWDFNYEEDIEARGALYRDQAFYSVHDYLKWRASQTE